jgi:hypothetical protein
VAGESWSYRCSICKELVEVDDLKEHIAEERAKDDWPGVLTWTREEKLPA